ncbi:hypothetical protein A9255_08150 [Xenorhabdus hominickii]|uniref:Uncharacterized protein n=1 Tax=Xenorhabdus hominickii TaxID=351679 RepID=A0ABN4S2I8_XENHO|nr:hypothetical protein A9255_08150 [Xenorhabdus hominickii]
MWYLFKTKINTKLTLKWILVDKLAEQELYQNLLESVITMGRGGRVRLDDIGKIAQSLLQYR